MQFAEAFERKLEQFLTADIPIFRDEYLAPGSDYPAELLRNLCKSVCMVALVVPEYFESSWCCAEWKAMQGYEQDRLGRDKHGLIIPVICGGDPTILERFIGPHQHVELRYIDNPARELSNKPNLRKIREIADTINQYARMLALKPPVIDCDALAVGLGPEQIIPAVSEPSPFG
jgi:hypothetical protein